MRKPHKLTFAEYWQSLHDNQPAPFNPDYVHETKREQEERSEADQKHETTIPVDLPEEEKRLLRKAFRAKYWDDFYARKKQGPQPELGPIAKAILEHRLG